MLKMLPKFRVVNTPKKVNRNKKTPEQYVQELKEKNPTIVPIEDYTTAREKFLHKCLICNHEWKATPDNILHGSGCPRCSKNYRYTPEEFKELTKHKINPNIEMLNDYVGSANPILCRCKVCGYVWSSDSSRILRGAGCRKCADKNLGTLFKKTENEFKNQLREKYQNDIECTNYNGYCEDCDFHCNICGYNWSSVANSLMYLKYGCPRCAHNGTYTPDEFRELAKDKINPYIEMISDYISSTDPILCRCKVCGYIWNSTSSRILLGNGCKKCAYTIFSEDRKKSEEEFRIQMQEKYQGNIDFSNYNGSAERCDFHCNKCGYDWNSIAYSMIYAKYGCPKCANKGIGDALRLSHEDFMKRLYEVTLDINVLGKYNGGHDKLECQCKLCGFIWFPKAYNLLSGYGCPQCNISKGEKEIRLFLQDNNIPFVPQKTFEKLLGVNGGLLSYDFHLPQYNLLIEFQGEQHERPIEFFGGETQFKIQQEHDKRKRNYAKLHNINLLAIWYYDIDRIEEILEETINNLKLESVETVGCV